MTNNNLVLRYLENLPKNEKEALEELRMQILQVVPEMEERLSRSVPFFYYKRKKSCGLQVVKSASIFFHYGR